MSGLCNEQGYVGLTPRGSRREPQNSALFGVRGNAITSLILPMPVTN